MTSDPTDPDRELDASIRRLVADAAADSPAAPDPSTFVTTRPAPAPRRRPSRWVTGTAIGLSAAAVVALVLVAVRDEPSRVAPADTTTPDEAAPVLTTTAPELPTTHPNTATTLEPTTTAPDPTTTVPAPIPITRPIIDPALCTPTSAREGDTIRGISLFARRSVNPIPIQVVGDPDLGPAGPFALVQRYFGDSYSVSGELVDINGWHVGISLPGNGNGQATWNLDDGSQGYIRSRGLDRDQLIAMVGALTPRPNDDPTPGFDMAPLSADLSLLHEQMNTSVEGHSAGSECRVESTGTPFRVSAIDGDPVFEYGGVIDRHPPLSVGVRDGVVIVIGGSPDPSAPTPDDVVDADPATWLDLRSKPNFPWETDGRMESISEGREVVLPLIPSDPATPTGYLTLRIAEQDGVYSLEVYTRDAVLADDAAFWMTELTPGGGGLTTASPETLGSVMGFRIGEHPPEEPLTVDVTISVIDGAGFVLQSTGPVQLIVERSS